MSDSDADKVRCNHEREHARKSSPLNDKHNRTERHTASNPSKNLVGGGSKDGQLSSKSRRLVEFSDVDQHDVKHDTKHDARRDAKHDARHHANRSSSSRDSKRPSVANRSHSDRDGLNRNDGRKNDSLNKNVRKKSGSGHSNSDRSNSGKGATDKGVRKKPEARHSRSSGSRTDRVGADRVGTDRSGARRSSVGRAGTKRSSASRSVARRVHASRKHGDAKIPVHGNLNIYQPSSKSTASQAIALQPRFLLIVVIVALIVIFVVVNFFMGGTQGQEQVADSETQGVSSTELAQDGSGIAEVASISDPNEEAAEAVELYVAAPADMENIPSGDGIQTFNLTSNSDSVPVLSEEEQSQIEGALNEFTSRDATLGFVFMDLNTGKGISFDVDDEVYGASSIKGPFCTYVCQDLVDEQESVSLSKSYKVFDEEYHSNGKSSVKNMVEMTITQSSNGNFAALRKSFSDGEYSKWLEVQEVSPDIHDSAGNFAFYDARDAAKLWSNVYEYFETDTETSQWLRSLMEETNVSCIRDGIDVEGATVANKAGWYVDSSEDGEDYNSLCDNAIISVGDEDYMMCIMSDARGTEPNMELMANLAGALMNARGELTA